MNWQRLADVMLRRPARPDSERVVKERQLSALEWNVRQLLKETRRQADGAHNRLASYRRVRIDGQ